MENFKFFLIYEKGGLVRASYKTRNQNETKQIRRKLILLTQSVWESL